MSKNLMEPGALEFLSTVREIVRPALRQGFKLTTTKGEPVTLKSLPELVSLGASIEMIAEGGQLIAVTLSDDERPDTKRPREGLPTFCQINPDGERTNFWVLPEGEWRAKGRPYRPSALRLDAGIFISQRDSFGRLVRLPDHRIRRIFSAHQIEKTEISTKEPLFCS